MNNKDFKFYNLEQAQNEAERIQEKAKNLSKTENPKIVDYEQANEIINEENRLFQGEKSSEVFGGKAESEAVKELYNESAKYFADIIKEQITSKDKIYKFADFGTYKGELLKKILELLSDYNFQTIGFDLEKNLMENSTVQEKITADLSKLPVENESVDFGIARYVLVWNNVDKQKKILNEISRIIKDFAIIQHAGADNDKSAEWREKFDDLLDGKEVPKLERHGYFFSSREEIENWLKENNINFQRILERKVEKVSNVFIERFLLNEKDAEKTRQILGDMDYIIQTTWVILPKEKREFAAKEQNQL